MRLPGDAAAVVNTKQQLLKKLKGLQQKLAAVLADNSHASSSSSSSNESSADSTAANISREEAGQEQDSNAAGLQQFANQLQQFGSLLCGAVPVEVCCNNPNCGNLAKMSELELVAGKGSRCSGCKVARYCGKDCQLEHWKQHKPACRRLQGTGSS